MSIDVTRHAELISVVRLASAARSALGSSATSPHDLRALHRVVNAPLASVAADMRDDVVDLLTQTPIAELAEHTGVGSASLWGQLAAEAEIPFDILKKVNDS